MKLTLEQAITHAMLRGWRTCRYWAAPDKFVLWDGHRVVWSFGVTGSSSNAGEDVDYHEVPCDLLAELLDTAAQKGWI